MYPRGMSTAHSTDCNRLDDTLGGKLLIGTAAGVATALPDFVDSRLARFLLYILGGSSLFGLIVYMNLQDDDPNNDPEAFEATFSTSSVWLTWLLLAAVVLVVLGSLWLSESIQISMADRLRKRGLRYPNSVFGVLTALGYVVATVQAQKNQ